MFDRSRQTDKARGVSLACQRDVNRPAVRQGGGENYSDKLRGHNETDLQWVTVCLFFSAIYLQCCCTAASFQTREIHTYGSILRFRYSIESRITRGVGAGAGSLKPHSFV